MIGVEGYLSPAFSKRSADELAFLRTVHDRTGFSVFWIDIVSPLLEAAGSKMLLEIGACEGAHTRWLLQYCERVDGRLVVIEPDIRPSLRRIVDRSKRVSLLAETSQEALPRLDGPIDAVLLEGDLNYHTVLTDLRGIEALCRRMGGDFPLVCFASAGWPYGRRDMYYDPDRIPREARHEYARMGMSPWSAHLTEGLVNHPFANAIIEGGPANGVLTAVETFVETSAYGLRLFTLPVNHGLGILCAANSREAQFVAANLVPPPALARFLETWELARINGVVGTLQGRRDDQLRRGARAWIGRWVRRAGGRILRMIER